MGSASPKTSSFLTDPNTSYAQVLAQHDSDGEEARWVWEESLAPLSMTRGGRTFFYLADGQDSVRQLTDESGRVTDSYFYDAWGNALAGGSGTTKNPFRYTGQQQDQDGKYFLRARYYNSGTGRFLSQDPVMGNGHDPVSLHRYLYAGDDAVNSSDPSGREFTIAGVANALSMSFNLYSAYSNFSAANAYDASGDHFMAGIRRGQGIVDLMGAVAGGGGMITGAGGGAASALAISTVAMQQVNISWAVINATWQIGMHFAMGGGSSGSAGSSGGSPQSDPLVMTPQEIADRIANAEAKGLNVPDVGSRKGYAQEGALGRFLQPYLKNFNRQIFGTNAGKNAETDMETASAIILSATGKGNKVKEASNAIQDSVINPLGKVVIVYAEEYGDGKSGAIKALTDTGAILTKSPQQLVTVLRMLGDV